MAALRSHDTQSLTREQLVLVAGGTTRRRWLTAGALLALMAATLIALHRPLGPPVRLADLSKDNARLQQDLEGVRLDLAMERATRAELERQIQVLNAQVTELTRQLEFVTSRATRRAVAVRPAPPQPTSQDG